MLSSLYEGSTEFEDSMSHRGTPTARCWFDSAEFGRPLDVWPWIAYATSVRHRSGTRLAANVYRGFVQGASVPPASLGLVPCASHAHAQFAARCFPCDRRRICSAALGSMRCEREREREHMRRRCSPDSWVSARSTGTKAWQIWPQAQFGRACAKLGDFATHLVGLVRNWSNSHHT